MEASNATSQIPYDGSLGIYVNLYYGTGGFGFLGLLALLVFIVEVERVDTRYSPFNISLMSYIVSLMALLILDGRTYEIMIGCRLSGSDYNFDRTALLNNVLKYIFTATMETSYLYYSWKRAGPILDAVFPNTEKIIRYLVLCTPVAFYFQLLPLFARLIFPSREVTIIASKILSIIASMCGLLTVTVDIILISAFIKFVQKTKQAASHEPDQRFMIISKYGIASVFLIICSLLFYVMFVVTDWDGPLFLVELFLVGVFWVLFGMKYALWNEEKRKQSSRGQTAPSCDSHHQESGLQELDGAIVRKMPATLPQKSIT